jgi:hypothetical protein
VSVAAAYEPSARINASQATLNQTAIPPRLFIFTSV